VLLLHQHEKDVDEQRMVEVELKLDLQG